MSNFIIDYKLLDAIIGSLITIIILLLFYILFKNI